MTAIAARTCGDCASQGHGRRCRFCGCPPDAAGAIEMGDGTVACTDQDSCWDREMEARGLR